MSRKRAKRRNQYVWITWAPEFAEMFRMVPSNWSPPEKIRGLGDAQRCTFTATFRRPDGSHVTAIVRLSRDPRSAEYFVTSERISMQFGGRP